MARKTSRLFVVNNVLLVLIILVNGYLIAVPFLPRLLFHISQAQGREQQLQNRLTPASSASSGSGSPAPQTNQLVIPAMLLDQPIIENTNMYRALDQGVWRWPGGSTPDKGGNTVLVGHRFTYTKPKGVFYFLDKLQRGDTVGIVWGGKTYVYRVRAVTTVKPTDASILKPTAGPTLTMYTCTPLWLPKDRLVITANLEKSYE